MALFKRCLPTSTSSTDRADAAELARARNLQPFDGSPFDAGVTSNLWRLNFALYGQREPIGVGSAEIAAPRDSSYHESYAGTIDGRRVVVTNHQTNIARLRAYNFQSVAVCAVELGTVAPIALVQPRALPFIGRSLHATATGDQVFDDRFVTVLMPTVSPQALTDDVRHRMMAHDDWAFLGDDDWLLCASKGRDATAEAISRRIDEVIGIVHAFPASIVPSHIDRSVDDLADRIAKISTVDEALTFLEQLSPDDRERLAHSDTPLAAFADVTTPDEAMARLESLDMPQRLQLLGMFQRLDEQ